jgi:hypothetical protein
VTSMALVEPDSQATELSLYVHHVPYGGQGTRQHLGGPSHEGLLFCFL